MPPLYFVGVDVGTGSARAALINSQGKVVISRVIQIKTWNPQPDYYEQSSDNIWKSVCQCVRVSIQNLTNLNLIKNFNELSPSQ